MEEFLQFLAADAAHPEGFLPALCHPHCLQRLIHLLHPPQEGEDLLVAQHHLRREEYLQRLDAFEGVLEVEAVPPLAPAPQFDLLGKQAICHVAAVALPVGQCEIGQALGDGVGDVAIQGVFGDLLLLLGELLPQGVVELLDEVALPRQEEALDGLQVMVEVELAEEGLNQSTTHFCVEFAEPAAEGSSQQGSGVFQIGEIEEGRADLIEYLAAIEEEVDGLASAEDHTGTLAVQHAGNLLSYYSEPLLPLLALVDLLILRDEELPRGVLQVPEVGPTVDVVEQGLQGMGEESGEEGIDCGHAVGAVCVEDGEDVTALEGLHCIQNHRQPLQQFRRVECPHLQLPQAETALVAKPLHRADPSVVLVQLLLHRHPQCSSHCPLTLRYLRNPAMQPPQI